MFHQRAGWYTRDRLVAIVENTIFRVADTGGRTRNTGIAGIGYQDVSHVPVFGVQVLSQYRLVSEPKALASGLEESTFEATRPAASAVGSRRVDP